MPSTKVLVSHDCEDVILESLILFPFSMSIRTTPSDQHANVIQNEDNIHAPAVSRDACTVTGAARPGTVTGAARLAISRPIVLLLHLSFIFSSISTTSDGRQTVAAVVVMSPLP